MVKSGETVSNLCLKKLKHVANCKQNQINKRLEELELKIKDDQNPLNLAITEKELADQVKTKQPKNHPDLMEY